ncbi:MAG: glycosyltransferase family 1 protein [Aquabacterium sp.]|uniref:glycosyltransferase n=1 Tax=Aquabacterium sp. TaxID=1872578 RepID=UPI00120E4BB9|nr:glycosyltransferase [Aquabacterium sp.]TAK94143.1 MAG: glycosyltransferase family 1 protein [Aquabacterium sp.]
MQLIFFCHPPFMQSQSMPRFARMIGEAMKERGHQVEYWAPQGRVHKLLSETRLASLTSLAKWAGYIDQYILFPIEVKLRLLPRRQANTLYVFCDQALGPWVPLVAQHPHVVHAHDLLALRSALGLIAENPTSFTGQLYQRYIRRGFRQAKRFISVSKRTTRDLAQFGGVAAHASEVVYNGLNQAYQPMSTQAAIDTLRQAGIPADERGHLLHIGGGQWYKNTAGVIRLYAHYAAQHPNPLPLLMVSPSPQSVDVQDALATVPAQGSVSFKQGLGNEAIQAAYSLAQLFLFPSLAEGFGWPIIEAQACGCPVLTTDDAPMNEIGGPAARYLPLLQASMNIDQWAQSGATIIDEMINTQVAKDPDLIKQRIEWASQFTQERAIEAYERIYQSIVDKTP